MREKDKNNGKKLVAETLIETILASIILSISILFSIGIVNNIFFSKKNLELSNALEIIQEEFYKHSINDPAFKEQTARENVIINKSFTDFDENLKILHIEISTTDSTVLVSSQTLVEYNEED